MWNLWKVKVILFIEENKEVKDKINPQLTGTRLWGNPDRSQGFTRFISNKSII